MTDPRHEPHGGGIRFESRDIGARAVVRLGLWITLVVVGVIIVLVPLIRYLAAEEKRQEPPTPLLARSDANRLPPEPRLQTEPFGDIIRLREVQGALIHSYGWVDRQAGIARVPVEEAAKLLQERGLPARAGSFAATQEGKP
jgi:hypothetical protein